MNTIQKIDYVFPFIIFVYGALMTFVLNQPRLMELAENRFPKHIVTQFNTHRGLGILCLVLGGLWGLQNIWVG